MEQSKTSEIQVPDGFTTVTEGKATILYPKGNQVFYNPAQEVNRDLSIMMIKLFQAQREKEIKQGIYGKDKPLESTTTDEQDNNNNATTNESKVGGLKILEGLSASGLRSIRYIKEIQGIDHIIANDLDIKSVECIKTNMAFNGIPESLVRPNHSEATACMYQHREEGKRFDVVDIDPYGGAGIFLDSAVQAVEDGGLLCVTCTDLAVLCGNHVEACYAKYGSISLHGRYNHEMGVRIVLFALNSHAARYKRYIVPLVSTHIDFYIRVFVRVYTSPSQVKKSPGKHCNVYQCTSCDNFWLQPLAKITETSTQFKVTPANVVLQSNTCNSCGHIVKMGGPMWHAPMHHPHWVAQLMDHLKQADVHKIYQQASKIKGLLSVIKEELTHPLYYVISSLANTLHLTSPPALVIKSALLNAGYQVSGTHCNPNGIKTNASNEVIWDIMRGWYKLHPSNLDKRSQTSPAYVILTKPASLEANFEKHPDASIGKDVPKFLPNPLPNWGPGTRAGKRAGDSKQNQGKKKKKKLAKQADAEKEQPEEQEQEGQQSV